jgi:membrane protease YdiL (CAAX protease family)
VLPPDGVAYPQVLRGESYAWWRSLLGVICGLSLFVLMTTVVSQAIIGVSWGVAGGGRPWPEYFADAYAFRLPIGMLAINLGIATLIPISWLLMALVHQVRPHWLSSVGPGIRWRYLAICLLVALLALNGVLALSLLIAPPPGWVLQPGFWSFLVIILLTSPLQAAAEEVFFRGYLMQALGSLVARPWFGVIVSSVVFALLHGTQNLPLFLDRLGFGLLAAVLVLRTGGLEAGIAAHVINNVFAYVMAGLTTSVAAVRAINEIGWLDAAFDVGGFALFAALAYLVAVRMRLRRTVDLSLSSLGARPALR